MPRHFLILKIKNYSPCWGQENALWDGADQSSDSSLVILDKPGILSVLQILICEVRVPDSQLQGLGLKDKNEMYLLNVSMDPQIQANKCLRNHSQYDSICGLVGSWLLGAGGGVTPQATQVGLRLPLGPFTEQYSERSLLT